MSKTKPNYSLTVIHFMKLSFFFVSVLSALLSWMFAVSRSVSLGTINPATVTDNEIKGFQLVTNIADNLAGVAAFFWVAGLIMAALYYGAAKKANKKADLKTVCTIIFVSALVILTIIQNEILRQLINSSL